MRWSAVQPACTLYGMSLVMRPRLIDNRQYWRAGASVLRRVTLLLVLALLTLIVLAARGSPIGTR